MKTKSILQKSTEPGNPVMNDCAGTLSSTGPCVLRRKHRETTRCKVDPSCLTKEIALVMLTHMQQVLSKKSGKDGNKLVHSASMMSVKAVKDIVV